MRKLSDIFKQSKWSTNPTMNDLATRFKSGGESEVPVIQTLLTFEQFFHPNKFIRVTPSLFQGQREFVNLRLHTDNKWYVYIKHVKLSTISITDLDMTTLVKELPKCKKFIDYIRLAEAKGEFKFECLCDKCNNSKIITQTCITPTIYNGFKVNIYEQQEIACKCTNK